MQRSHCYVDCWWNYSQNQSLKYHIGHWRLWKSLSNMHIGSYLHWRWWSNGDSSWPSPLRYGVRSVPPNWYLWCWMLDDWGLSRIRRYSAKQCGRKVYDQICPFSKRFSIERCCEPGYDHGDHWRKRSWSWKRSYLPSLEPFGSSSAPWKASRYCWNC